MEIQNNQKKWKDKTNTSSINQTLSHHTSVHRTNQISNTTKIMRLKWSLH